MTTPTPSRELARQLDQAFGAGPATTSPVDHLTAGRRSLRRRRGAGALATVAGVAILSTVTFVGLDGDGPDPTGTVKSHSSRGLAALQGLLTQPDHAPLG